MRSYSWTKSRSSIVSGQTAIDTQRPLLKNILKIYPSDRRRKGEEVFTKWSLILDAYHTIRKTILNNHRAMSVTDIQLPLLKRETLQQWFNEKSKDEEKKILMQGLALPTPKMTVAKAPEALPKPTSLPAGSTDPFSFNDPPSKIGMAKEHSKRTNTSCGTCFSLPDTFLRSCNELPIDHNYRRHCFVDSKYSTLHKAVPETKTRALGARATKKEL